MNVVPMDFRHLSAVVEIERDSFATPWSPGAFINELSNALAHYFVLEEGGDVLGYGGYYAVADEAQIVNFAIERNHRRRGLGTELFRRLLADAGERGLRYAFLDVNERNAAAIGLYESFGFRQIGRRKKYYEDTDDALIYELDLLPDGR